MEKSVSQIATSISQSKRLLAAGLDPESADMCYANVELNPNYLPDIRLSAFPYAKCVETYKTVGLIAEDVVPAWSLSRLWDAFGLDVLGGWFSVGSSTSEDVIEELVRMLENRYANH